MQRIVSIYLLQINKETRWLHLRRSSSSMSQESVARVKEYRCNGSGKQTTMW